MVFSKAEGLGEWQGLPKPFLSYKGLLESFRVYIVEMPLDKLKVLDMLMEAALERIMEFFKSLKVTGWREQ